MTDDEEKTPRVSERAPLFLDEGALDNTDRFRYETARAVGALNDAVNGLREDFGHDRLGKVERAAAASARDRKTAKKAAWTAALALAGSLGTFAVFALRAADAHGVETEKIRRIESDIDRLERAIDDVRRQCFQRSSLDAEPSFPVADLGPLKGPL